MGWSFRKSARFGPFRLNFSKSGIGVSAGVRGARVSTGPRGTYVNVGTNGFYYRQKVGEGYTAASSRRGAVNPNPIHSNSQLPPLNSNYPTFPKHGPPRIVATLGWLILPIILLCFWILAYVVNENNS